MHDPLEMILKVEAEHVIHDSCGSHTKQPTGQEPHMLLRGRRSTNPGPHWQSPFIGVRRVKGVHVMHKVLFVHTSQ